MGHNKLSRYNSEIDAWVVAAVRSGVKDFWQLVSALPGVYPTDVREAVDRLTKECRIPGKVGEEQPKLVAGDDLNNEVPGLPTPHPLSSDWRFTRKTAADLLNLVFHRAGEQGGVALLGTPSVYFLAAIDSVPGRFHLLDDNNSLAGKLPQTADGSDFSCCDVKRDRVDIPPVQAVLADPPWYMEDVLGFLRTAARVCSHGGTVFLGFASEGTRPDIAAERDIIVGKACEMGLRFVGLEPLTVSYATPFFEHNALRAADFKHIPATWRHGDLLEFRKDGDVRFLGKDLNSVPCSWMGAWVGGIEIRVRRVAQKDFADPRLDPLVDGNILPSVSRRDPVGKTADVWTTGNRVYRCEGKGTLLSILRALDEEKDPIQAIAMDLGRSLKRKESEGVEKAVTQIRAIVETEKREVWKFYNEHA